MVNPPVPANLGLEGNLDRFRSPVWWADFRHRHDDVPPKLYYAICERVFRVRRPPTIPTFSTFVTVISSNHSEVQVISDQVGYCLHLDIDFMRSVQVSVVVNVAGSIRSLVSGILTILPLGSSQQARCWH
jgi:hypothetical protein